MTVDTSTPHGEGVAHGGVRWLTLWVFVLVLALQPFTEDPATPIKALLAACVLVPGFLWLLFSRRVSGNGVRWSQPGVLLVLAFIAAGFLAAGVSDFPERSLYGMRHWTAFALATLFAAHTIRDADTAWRLLGAVVVAVACSAVYGLLQYAGWDPFPWSIRDVEEYRALPSFYGNPNLAGHALLLAFPLGVGCLIHAWNRPLRALLFVICINLIGFHLYLTQMRSARIALALALTFAVAYTVLLLVLRKPKRVVSVLVALGLLAGALGGVTVSLSSLLRDEGPLPVDSSEVLRVNGYSGAAAMLRDHPALGVGPGNYAVLNALYWTDFEQEWFATKHKKNAHVHCEPLEIAVETGLPGVGLFFALLAWALLAALSLTARGAPFAARLLGVTLAAALVAFLADGVFGFNLHAPVSGGLFFLLLGIVAGVTAPGGIPIRRWRVALLLLAAVGVAAVHGWSFAAEYALQRGHVASVAAREAAEADRTEEAIYARDAAKASILIARRMLPWDARPPLALARLAEADESWPEAAVHYGDAVTRRPHNPAILAARARVLLASDGLTAARADARAALERCEPLATAHAVLGEAAYRAAKEEQGAARIESLTEARTHLARASECGAADFARVQWMLARTCVALGDNHGAAGAFHRAVKEDPGALSYWEDYGTWARADDPVPYYQDLHAALRSAYEQKKPTPGLAGRLANLLGEEVESHGYDACLAGGALYLALERTPNDPWLWAALLKTVPESKRLETVRLALQTVATGSPDDATLRGRIEAIVDGPAEARTSVCMRLAEQAEGDSADAAALAWLAEVAADVLTDGQGEQTGRAMAMAATGRALVAAGRFRRGAALLSESASGLQGRYGCDALLAWSKALAALGEPKEALVRARDAVALGSNRVDVRRHFARLLAETGRDAEAKLEYLWLLRKLPQGDPARADVEAAYGALGKEAS